MFNPFRKKDGDLLHLVQQIARLESKYGKRMGKAYASMGDILYDYREEIKALRDKIDRIVVGDNRFDCDAYITKAGESNVESSE